MKIWRRPGAYVLPLVFVTVAHASEDALLRRLRDRTCTANLNAGRDYSPQLRTWFSERARTVFPGGIEVDVLALRTDALNHDPARAREVAKAFAAIAQTRAANIAVERVQVVVREISLAGPDVMVVADRLTWDPRGGHAASGEFMVLAPTDAADAIDKVLSSPRYRSVRRGWPTTREMLVVTAGKTPADRYLTALELLHELRTKLWPAWIKKRNFGD